MSELELTPLESAKRIGRLSELDEGRTGLKMPAMCYWRASRAEAISCFPVFSRVSDKEEFSTRVRDHSVTCFHWV